MAAKEHKEHKRVLLTSALREGACGPDPNEERGIHSAITPTSRPKRNEFRAPVFGESPNTTRGARVVPTESHSPKKRKRAGTSPQMNVDERR